MSGTLRLTLTREVPDRERTFGVLERGRDRICWTMEPGTDDRDFPRVPAGFYHLVDHPSDRYGTTVALIGDQVAHFYEPGIDRSTILIHAGNRDDHTKGCILVGMNRGKLQGEPAVLSSKTALAKVLELIWGADEAYLTIR